MGIHTTKELLGIALLPFRKNKIIGFVPTMGALHQGHLSLVQQALNENDCVVVSIFVNPTQFNNTADLDTYPRTLENDIALLHTIKGNIFIYAPDANDIYNGHIVSKKYQFGGLEHEMEGKHRPGHFDGVGTVLNILFRNIAPHAAYFGEKDFQQLQIVKKLVEIEQLPVTVVGCEIVREKNGLAMSSRNKRLTAQQFEYAAIISATLKKVKEKFNELSIEDLNQLVASRFLNHPIQLEYFEIADSNTLKTAHHKTHGTSYRAFIAAFAGDVRLIDNMPLNKM